MINYAHLKSQMIQLLDLLRSILYPNVFDAMEEAHSKEELEAAARRQLREILERIYREPPQYDDVIDTLFSKLPAIRDTLDTDYAAHRQRFLAEQGYAYRIVDADDLLGPAIPDVGAE